MKEKSLAGRQGKETENQSDMWMSWCGHCPVVSEWIQGNGSSTSWRLAFDILAVPDSEDWYLGAVR